MRNQTPKPEVIESLVLVEIARSATNRKTFKPEALQEMADSIREKGVIQPIVVRPVSCIEDEARRKAAGMAKFELVCGERRWRGSEIAKQTHIPGVIRELSDHEALKLQVIENAQREDVDALDEAEQLSGLLTSGKSTIAELVSELGKSRATIYGRVKLLDAPTKAKAAYRAGRITPQVLLLLARIPNAKVAEDATECVLQGRHYGEPLSFRQVQQLIAENYMTQLKGAPFDPKDTTLLPCAGACAACPILKGGRQDRVIGFDFILGKRSGRVPIPSFCVEQSRWHRRGSESDKVFSASPSYLSSKSVKLSAKVSASQAQVWSSVAEEQEKLSQAVDRPDNNL